MIERSRDIKILYREFKRGVSGADVAVYRILGVIRIVAHVGIHGTIFLHGLNISYDYLNFHSP